ncbi:MAG: hypothetical protein AAFX99_35640, partial [Myxococcota bacterium]
NCETAQDCGPEQACAPLNDGNGMMIGGVCVDVDGDGNFLIPIGATSCIADLDCSPNQTCVDPSP